MNTTNNTNGDQAAQHEAERRDAVGRLIETIPIPPLARTLQLEPHPEGGWFRQTWAGDAQVALSEKDPHPSRTDDKGHKQKRRPAATLIIFFLPAGEASKWHKVESDEVWIWNGLGELELDLGGNGEEAGESGTERILLGDPRKGGGRQVQGIIPGGTWQRTLPGTEDALMSCMVSPGFSFEDFQT